MSERVIDPAIADYDPKFHEVLGKINHAYAHGLENDPISMNYDEVKCRIDAQTLRELGEGLSEALESRNRTQMLLLEVLHVLAARGPHAELVREKLATGTNVFERACDALGVDMRVEGILDG